jgi:nucleotide-binding universal stress UspA family protein
MRRSGAGATLVAVTTKGEAMSALTPDLTQSAPRTIFDRVLVGIDGSDAGREAAWQAAALVTPGTPVTLVAAWQVVPPVVMPMAALPTFAGDERAAEEAAEEAIRVVKSQFPSAHTRILRGFAPSILLDEIRRLDATLVAVGAHGHGRARGIVVGSTATNLIHTAPCSVLLARANGTPYPRRVAVGVDGSPASARAWAAAQQVAERFDADVAPVVAERDDLLDLAAVSSIVGEGFHVVPEAPVPTLLAAAADADLLFVGSRGLRGLRALGSVSERVAHGAACTVVVVR